MCSQSLENTHLSHSIEEKKNAMTNTAILLVLWKIRKTTKQVNFLNDKLIRITAKTYEILPIVSKAKTVAVNNLLHLP